MKKGFFVLFGLLIGMLVMGPITSHGQMTQPDQQQSERDLNQQQPPSDLEFEEGRGAAPGGGVTLTQGKLSGEVVSINQQTGTIEIKTEEGVTNRFMVEEGAKGQLNQIKKGDQVDLVMTLRATPQQGTQGGSMEQPPMTR
ncbi:MAG: hypothetical protein MPW14_18630 [Candidatus Manganitrophus sp.]|nr:MAG: hypothetical protein MPW17_10785 [Candidatus Manganitrophus sp.]WDT79144.1 MAG: hypothetical protein MPW14_18630 [Candidatus Manganitrophus sp.]